jgi:hypothetical protein
MRGGKVNERILDAIGKSSESDRLIRDFLIEMIYEEATNRGWFKDVYKKQIEKYVKKAGEEDEN